MKKTELAHKIIERRKSLGMTQDELASHCSINVRTIQRIEAGDVTPRSHTMKVLFQALNINEEYKNYTSSSTNPLAPYMKIGIPVTLVMTVILVVFSVRSRTSKKTNSKLAQPKYQTPIVRGTYKGWEDSNVFVASEVDVSINQVHIKSSLTFLDKRSMGLKTNNIEGTLSKNKIQITKNPQHGTVSAQVTEKQGNNLCFYNNASLRFPSGTIFSADTIVMTQN